MAEIKARFVGDNLDTSGDALVEVGDYGFFTAGEPPHRYIDVRCPFCLIPGIFGTHHVPIDKPGSWTWDDATKTLSPSVKVTRHDGVCHWNLTNGVFIVHGDSFNG